MARMSRLDNEIGSFLEALRERPDWDRTVLIATGDMASSFNKLLEPGSTPWNQLHREGVQVPADPASSGSGGVAIYSGR